MKASITSFVSFLILVLAMQISSHTNLVLSVLIFIRHFILWPLFAISVGAMIIFFITTKAKDKFFFKGLLFVLPIIILGLLILFSSLQSNA
jgi:hypothetical protein